MQGTTKMAECICCCSPGSKCGCCGSTASCAEWFRKHRCVHVTLIIFMWTTGFMTVLCFPIWLELWVGRAFRNEILFYWLAFIGAAACGLFSAGAACLGCMCANDIAREDLESGRGGKKVFADGGAAQPEP